MKSSQAIGTKITGSHREFRKCWMAYALLFSVILHLGAALVFIGAADFTIGGRNTHSFLIQDIDFTTSVASPVKPSAVLRDESPAKSSPTLSAPQESGKPVQEVAAEQPVKSTDSSDSVGGLISTPLGLGMTHGYFSGLADGRSLRDDIRGYYFEMVEKINREWWSKAGQLNEPLRQDGVFDVLIQREGTIVSVRMLKGTGSSEADKILTEIIRSASPLPPLPSTYDMGLFRAPLRIKMPSNLFRVNN